MKIAIVKNEEHIDGFDSDNLSYIPGEIVGHVDVDESAGFVFAGTEQDRVISLMSRAVEAWKRGEKVITA